MDNRDYIKKKFENDGIKAPESLSEDSILRMLGQADGVPVPEAAPDTAGKEKDHAKASPKKRTWIRPENRKVLAIAASAMIVIFGIAALSPLIGREPDTAAVDGELYEFRSTSEIERMIKSLDDQPAMHLFQKREQAVEETLDYESGMAAEEGAGSSANDSAAGTSGLDMPAGSHSETYLQVDDVDEADIVKTDGRYIY